MPVPVLEQQCTYEVGLCIKGWTWFQYVKPSSMMMDLEVISLYRRCMSCAYALTDYIDYMGCSGL